MQAKQLILIVIQRRQLKWSGYSIRMYVSRWPKNIYQWTPHGRQRRGRPKQLWKNQVTDSKRDMNMEEDIAEETHILHLEK